MPTGPCRHGRFTGRLSLHCFGRQFRSSQVGLFESLIDVKMVVYVISKVLYQLSDNSTNLLCLSAGFSVTAPGTRRIGYCFSSWIRYSPSSGRHLVVRQENFYHALPFENLKVVRHGTLLSAIWNSTDGLAPVYQHSRLSSLNMTGTDVLLFQRVCMNCSHIMSWVMALCMETPRKG